MLDVSRAITFNAVVSTTRLTPSILACTVEVSALVVLEPARAAEPPPETPAAIDSMLPELVACTLTCPGARTVLLVSSAVTSPPMSLTATAAPTAAPPEPLIVPAKEKMSLSLSALTLNAPPLVTCVTLTACALTLALSVLVVKLPLTEAKASAAPEAATDLISPRRSASTATAAAACNVMPDKLACTVLPTWLTAIAASKAPVTAPDTLPARVRTVAASSACTVSEVAEP